MDVIKEFVVWSFDIWNTSQRRVVWNGSVFGGWSFSGKCMNKKEGTSRNRREAELEGGQDKETSIDAKLDRAAGKSDERSDCEDELDYEDSDGVQELVFVFTTVVLLMFSVFSMCPHCAQTCRSALRRQLKGPKIGMVVRAQQKRKAVGPRDPDNKCMCVVQEARSLATFVAGDTRPRIRKEEADDVSCTEAPARCDERENVYWTHCVLILIAPMLRCRSSSCRRFCFLNKTALWHCYEKR